MKRCLSLVLVFALVLACAPVITLQADAATIASGTCGNNLTWVLDKNGTFTVSGTGNMADYDWESIPWNDHKFDISCVIIEDGVTSISNDAFYNCSSLTSVTIPDSVISIGAGAFGCCNSLTNVEIGDGVTSIGKSAFYLCYSLTSVMIPDGVTNIGANAFSECYSLTNIAIPDSVTSIGKSAFYWCYSLTSVTIPGGITSIDSGVFSKCSGLTSVTIPVSVTNIDYGAFFECSNLTDIYYDGTEEQWNTIIGSSNSYLTNATIHFAEEEPAVDTCEQYLTWEVVDGEATITDCDTSISGDVVIPDTLGGYPVTSIGSDAFENCSSLTSVEIPDSVTSIGDWAFYNCSSLTSVEIPDSVTSIGDWAFYNCNSLTSVEIPDSVTSIGDWAFYNCSSLTSVVIGDNVTSIGFRAFENCSNLTNIEIPDSVTSIGAEAFDNCSSLTSIEIPDSVTSIGAYAFQYCSSLTSVVIGDSVASIGDAAFYNCSSLTSVVIGDSVASIGNGAFCDCSSLTSIEIPDSVTSIGNDAFSGCSSLTSIEIPDSVTSIGNRAFSGCSSLTDVYYSGTEEQWNAIAIGSGNDSLTNATIHFKTVAVENQYVINGEVVTVSFDTLEEALVAVSAGTIKLLADATVNTVILKPDVILDLNGYTLTANLLVALGGAIVTDGEECTGGGLLKIAKDNLALTQDNGGIVPVWNGVDGYVFTKVNFQQMAKSLTGGAAQYIFQAVLSNPNAVALLADGGADNAVKVKASLTWNNGQCQQFYTYGDDLVAQVFASGGKLVFSLNITGIAGITDMVANAMVVTDSYAQTTNVNTAIKAG